MPEYLQARDLKPAPPKRFCKLTIKHSNSSLFKKKLAKQSFVSNLVGLDIPDYVMTNDDSALLPSSSRHAADMVSLIKRFDLAVSFDEFGSDI